MARRGTPPPAAAHQQGRRSYHAGASAEEQVARVYQQRGCELLTTRWRGQAGEIDLILRQGAVVVFAEVKASKTRDRAAARITPAQVRRIYAAAEEFLAGQPGGQLTEVRFDAALVSGTGEIEIIENAFGLD